MTGVPPLSIVVATRQGWPGMRACLESLASQALAVGAEVIVADGSGRPAPSRADVGEHVAWISSPGGSVFQLAGLAFARSRAPVIAETEDHCTVRPGWAAGHLRGHADDPEAAVIGGAIENGSTGTLLDWASYYITQGPFQAPLRNGPATRVATEANLSFKRRAVEGLDDRGGLGAMILLHLLELGARGERMVNDDRMVVDHFQSVGAGETSAIHFHNGRTIAAFRRQRMGGREALRVAALPLLWPYRALRAVRVGWAKGRLRSTLLASAPWILWLELCHAAGELAGYAAGAGDSPTVLR